MTRRVKYYKKPQNVNTILVALRDIGPMTKAEMADYLKKPKNEFGAMISRLVRQDGPRSPQRVHIAGWVHDHPGARSYPRAVYAFGPGVNVKKPSAKRLTKRLQASYYKRSAMVASVFDLGTKVKLRIGRDSKARKEVMKNLGVVSVRKVAE